MRSTSESSSTPTGGTKAMVLAAGLGTRLRPLTESLPKCLVPLAGRPLIDWTLRWLHSVGIRECVINLHYLQELVKEFIGDGDFYGLKVRYSYEPVLLGTAGAVRKAAEFFDAPFYVIYSDNFSFWNLENLRFVHEDSSAAATIAVHWREDVTQSGVVETDDNNRILRFVEKPYEDSVQEKYVNAGFYYLDPRVLNYIQKDDFCDFGYDVFPRILKAGEQVYAVKMDEPIIGIDTKEAYEKANQMALAASSGFRSNL